MKFDYTGLKKDKVVEEAFEYAQEHNKKLVPEITQQLEKQLEEQYQQRLAALDDARDAGYVTEDQYAQNKAQLDRSAAFQKRSLPMLAQQQLDYLFGTAKLAPALELQTNSESTSPALIAAALLVDCVRDPVDYKKVEAQFGAAVAGLVAEVLHIDSYPGTAAADISSASVDAKRIFMAGLTTELSQIVNQLAMMPPGAVAEAPPKYEETMFNQVQLLWGNDKKQDKRLVDVFNRAAEALSSPFRIEVTPAGTPALVESTSATPQTPTFPGQKKGPKLTWGDDKTP
ncbi:MAG: HD domain-containing protein [Alphaproteobacteria bacterium]|nr:HD domain-containing protein [Alphaproteobacteria bacterium]